MELLFHLVPAYGHTDSVTSPEQEFVLRSNTTVQMVPWERLSPTWYLQHLHPVQQGRGNGRCGVCSGDKEHLREVEGHVEVMICEAVVLLWVQDLRWHLETVTVSVLREKKLLMWISQLVVVRTCKCYSEWWHLTLLLTYLNKSPDLKQCSCRVSLQALPKFVHLIQEEDWIIDTYCLQTVDDAAGHAAYICAPGGMGREPLVLMSNWNTT